MQPRGCSQYGARTTRAITQASASSCSATKRFDARWVANFVVYSSLLRQRLTTCSAAPPYVFLQAQAFVKQVVLHYRGREEKVPEFLYNRYGTKLQFDFVPMVRPRSWLPAIASNHLRKDWQIIVMLVPCDPHIPRQNCMTHINATTSFHDHLYEHNSHTNCLCGRRNIANSLELRTRSAKTCSKT